MRVVAYIDGFNLYHGLRTKRWKRYYWLDLVGLARSLLRDGQKLIAVHYFTAHVRDDEEAQRRQDTYLQALATLPDLEIHYGRFQETTYRCSKCRETGVRFTEKHTDVAIAVHLLQDAYEDRFDVAIVVSADSDLVPALEAVRKRFPLKRIVVAQPPNRHSNHLTSVASASFTIGKTKLRQNQLPDCVVGAEGRTLRRPETWR